MTDTYVAPPKPPLSDPMAEALAEDAAAEAARLAQAAAEQEGATPEPQTEETPPAEPAAASGEPEPTEETPPARRKQEMVAAPLLAKERNKRQTAETELAEARAQLAAAQALINAQNGTTDPAAAPVTQPVTPPAQPQRVYTEAEMQEAAKQVAYYNDLNARADQVYSAGKEKFGDWADNVGNLVAMEVMTPQFVEAAMATGAPVDVIHHLGADLEEAARISALPPVRMGVELARIAQQKGAAPAPKRPISGAPAPIEPVNGRPDPTVNLAKLAEGNDMAAYVAERKKQGDPWAR